ncbi:MAG: sulfane dehydrogenase subunit SoxC [Candidatus Azotimanducaceae bacterium]|jgi:sulfane dehydrogenase subunit SoxC
MNHQKHESLDSNIDERVAGPSLAGPVTAATPSLAPALPRTSSITARRGFLRSSLGLMGAAAAGTLGLAKSAVAAGNLPPEVPSWSRVLGSGVLTNPYGQPSPFEANVQRRTVDWLTPGRVASISFTPLADLKGIITPSGLVFERYHAGVPEIDPDQHRLMIHGMVDRPITLTMSDLMRFPATSRIAFLECPANGGMEWRGAQMNGVQFTHGMLACCEWTGVLLSTLLAEVGISKKASWILAEGADGASMSRSIPMDKALDDALIVYAQNGEALRPEQGYPVRLINPGWEGNTCIKWLRRLEVGDQPWYQREETSKYSDLMPDGNAREFTFVQECNSVITSPSPEKPLSGGKGKYWVEGLAWSGRGEIKGVDVSFDGGRTFRQAKFTSIVLPRALTRFGIELDWDGSPLLLQSRAIDETGYVQPTYQQLRDVRGSNSIYHKNAIHTWKVLPTGDVANVQLS